MNGRQTHFVPAISSYVIFAALFAVPLIVSILALEREKSAWVLVAGVACAYGSIALSLLFRRIEIDGDTITYRTLTTKRSLSLPEIRSAEVKVGSASYWVDRFSGVVRLEIEPHPHAGKKPLRINLKPFRRADVRALLDFVARTETKR